MKYFDVKDKIIIGFDDIVFSVDRCDEYIDLLERRIDQMAKESSELNKSLRPGYDILKTMVENKI